MKFEDQFRNVILGSFQTMCIENKQEIFLVFVFQQEEDITNFCRMDVACRVNNLCMEIGRDEFKSSFCSGGGSKSGLSRS